MARKKEKGDALGIGGWEELFSKHENLSLFEIEFKREIYKLVEKYSSTKKGKKKLARLKTFLSNFIDSSRVTKNEVMVPGTFKTPKSGRDVGELMARGKGSFLDSVLSPFAGASANTLYYRGLSEIQRRKSYKGISRDVAGLLELFNPSRPQGVLPKYSSESIDKLTMTSQTYPEVKAPDIEPYSPLLPVTAEEAALMRKGDKLKAFSDKVERFKAETATYGNVPKSMNRSKDGPFGVDPFGEEEKFQNAIGADTGANRNGDFAYLAEIENRQNNRKKLHDTLLKGLPSFLKDSKKSTEDLHYISVGFKELKKLPFGIGRLATMNPAFSIPTAALGIMNAGGKILDTIDSSNGKIVHWQNAQNLYGNPSKAFTEAAYKSGLKDPAEIAKLYGQLTMRFGSAEAGIQAIGSQMGNLPPIARMAMTKSLGLDEKSMALFDIMSGNGHLGMSRARAIAANRAMVDNALDASLSSNTSALDSAKAFATKITGAKGFIARDMEDGWSKEGMREDFDRLMESSVGASVAAESLRRHDASGDTITTTSTNTFVFNGDIVANDPQQLLQKTGEMVNGGNTEILERFNNRVNGAKR